MVVGVLAGPSHASPTAEAKAKIKEGKQLLKQKQIDAACEAFAEAERIVPVASTTLLLADCREKQGKLATAHALFVKARSKKRANRLARRLLHVTIVVPPERRVFGLELEVDGDALAEAEWGERIAYDPGPHTIAAKAPGRVPWSTTITVDKATKDQTVEVPALDVVPKPPPPPPPPPPRVGATSREGRRYKGATIGLSVLGVGGVGLGVVLGLRARSLAADADAICPNDACLDAGALDLNKRARTSATYANVALIGGGVALAGAAVLFWIGRPSVRPVVEREQVGLVVEGAW